MLNNKTDYKVKGYTNKWSVIDTYKEWSLLENCTYGDETCYLVVRNDVEVVEKRYQKISKPEYVTLPTITSVVCETYDGLIQALEDECII